MYKELIITIVIFILIVVGNIVTQNNTKNSVDEIVYELTSFRKNIIKEDINKEHSQEHMNSIENIWNNKYEKMAYYIEHNELEKVGTELAKLKADIEVGQYEMAVESLDNCVFILEHIKDKTAFKIENIF